MHALTGTFAAAALVLYGATALADNTSPSMLDPDQRAEIIRTMPEDMKRGFQLHDEPLPFRDSTFLDPAGTVIDLADLGGGLTVLNFWATWCAPCRKEMPYLDDLHADLRDEGVRVVTVSLDREGTEKAQKWLEGQKLTNLGAYSDPKTKLSKQMGVSGLPVTAILGPDAREIGRMRGEAKWNSPEAKAWVRKFAKATGAQGGGGFFENLAKSIGSLF